jgi:hypothetical protein
VSGWVTITGLQRFRIVRRLLGGTWYRVSDQRVQRGMHYLRVRGGAYPPTWQRDVERHEVVLDVESYDALRRRLTAPGS